MGTAKGACSHGAWRPCAPSGSCIGKEAAPAGRYPGERAALTVAAMPKVGPGLGARHPVALEMPSHSLMGCRQPKDAASLSMAPLAGGWPAWRGAVSPVPARHGAGDGARPLPPLVPSSP